MPWPRSGARTLWSAGCARGFLEAKASPPLSPRAGRDSGSAEGTLGSPRRAGDREQKPTALLASPSWTRRPGSGAGDAGRKGCPWSWERLRGLVGVWGTGWRADGAGAFECFGGHLPCPVGSQSLALGPRSLCLRLPEASSSAGLLARPPPWLPRPRRTQVCVWHHMQLCLPPPPSEVPVTRAPSA